MRSFSRGIHDAVILDDIRDFQFLVDHQDKLQGKYNAEVEFGSTPGGQLAYFKDLWAVPFVATANFSTANSHLLEQDDFLKNEGNRVLLKFPPPEWEAEQEPLGQT